ncbi:EAL domain-containing protein (putative c-di-GMP-specific phosphodiesterase class I) [Grimontella sp. AG753]|nr:EAL domain-containing protein (putative c-di-GMP-specific phosphodiesterase class I) [Grimontella sp. AG753]
MKKISAKYISLVVLFFVIALLSGFTASWFQIKNEIKDNINERIELSLTAIDAIFTHAENVATIANNYKTNGCSENTLIELRKIVASNPDIRSINFYRDGNIYCTTVLGERSGRINIESYNKSDIIIVNGTFVIPNRPTFIFIKKFDPNQGVIIGIDAHHISNVLNMVGEHTPFYVKVKNNLLKQNGDIVNISTEVNWLSSNSQRYPYSVGIFNDELYIWKEMYRIGKIEIVMIVLFTVFSTFMFGKYLNYRNTLEYQLNHAVLHGHIIPFIQPIVEAHTGKIIGGELLLRWRHPLYGNISPEKFIPVAEQIGIIDKLTLLSFDYLVDVITRSGLTLPKNTLLCFNVSPHTFLDKTIVKNCQSIIQKLANYSPVIVLEITEREPVKETVEIHKIVRAIKTLGVRFSLDDFGTGNANYNYIRIFKPEYIKIDKIFTRINSNLQHEHFYFQDILHLAKKYNCETIAEGIETEEQIKLLRESGVDFMQGFYFSKAIEIERFISLINLN